MNLITERRELSSVVTLMKVLAPDVAKRVKAGQFIILRVDEKGERVPLTVAEGNPETGEVTIMFQIAGATTRQLSMLNAGDYLADFVGPLGVPTEHEGATKVCVVGGGVGNAIAYPQAKALHEAKIPVDAIIGFKTADMVMLEDEFKAVTDNLYVTTDDGTYGIQGFVTNQLETLIQ